MNKQLKQKKPRIFFTGVGGQGTLTATKLLAQAALIGGVEAVAGEVHGMAQRGGVVESVLLLGGWRSPRLDLGEADIILGFEPLETLRSLPYLASGGIIFSATNPVAPLSVCLGLEKYPEIEEIKKEAASAAQSCHFIPCRELGLQAGSAMNGNSALLGALCASGNLPFGLAELENAIEELLPPKIKEANLNAARLGSEYFLKS